MRQVILDALEDRYNAQISEADATLKIYLEHSVGIGEHPQHQVMKKAKAKIKKVIKGLKKASKLHAGQAKTLKGVIGGRSKKGNR